MGCWSGEWPAALLVFLVLAAGLAHARQGDAPGAALSVKPLAGGDGEPGVYEGIEGDPFGSETDPFADDPVFQTGPEDAAASGIGQNGARKGLTAGLHGYLESRNQVRTTDGDAISTRQRFWLEAEGGLFQSSSPRNAPSRRFFASAAIDIDPAAADLSDDHKPLRVHPEEVFVTLDTAGIDVALGRKMLRWGTGDGINPLDLINPLDHRDPVASGRADSRVPILLGQSIVRLPTAGAVQEAILETVVIPLARVNELNAPGSAWESRGLKALREADARGLLLLEEPEEPDALFKDAEFGLRLAATFSGWDLALIGFYGYLDAPVLKREIIQNETGDAMPRLTPVHPVFSAFGVNFAKGLSRSTIRGELAVKPDLPVTSAAPDALPGYERRTAVEGVVGIDRTFGANRYANIQYFGTFTHDAGDVVRERYDHGITYEINDLFWRDDLKAGVRGILSFSNQGWTCEPYAEYRIGDDWLLAASLLVFEGPENGRFGQYTANDLLTVRLRYSF